MNSRSILFLNQVAGPLFRELAEDVARELGGAELFTGNTSGFARTPDAALSLVKAPDYDRRSLWFRVLSWLRYFASALRHVFKSSDKPLLFIVSNPPFLPALGWLASVLRGQPYCVLVYDLYPGVLVRLGRISERGLIAMLWRWFNRLVWARAAMVYTIGDHMAANIRKEGAGLENMRITVIPNWADIDFIKPLAKKDNAFFQSLGWSEGRSVVLYSGNLGDTHNLDALLDAADRLRDRPDVGFLIIGAGARWAALCDEIEKRALKNVRLLPFQPEALLPQTLPAGDIAVVAMETAVAGYLVPSKTFYYLAAGSALLALVPKECEVADLIEHDGCGIRVGPEAGSEVQAAIEKFLNDSSFLSACKMRAREVAVKNYGRGNTARYVVSLKSILADF